MATVVSRTGELIDDMVIRDAECTPHVLNAVSPGLTSSMAFARYLIGYLNERNFLQV